MTRVKKRKQKERQRDSGQRKRIFFFWGGGVCGIFVLALKSEFFYEYKIHTKIRFDPIAKC